MRLDDHEIASITATRFADPDAVGRALSERPRRPLHDGQRRLLIVAADHPARGALSVGGDVLAMADRAELLGRLRHALAHPRVDGVLASADVLEDLALLGCLDDRLAFGTMNRGGLPGSAWELDDRFTAYDPAHVASMGLDGGKMLLRIDPDDSGTLPTLEACARAVTALADRGVIAMVEPLPYRSDDDGRSVLDTDEMALVRAVAIASGLGASSARTWLKVPASRTPQRVLRASSLPTLLLGGDPGSDPADTYDGWRHALATPSSRGLVVGRALLYPPRGTVAEAIGVAADLVTEADEAATKAHANDQRGALA